MPSQNIAVSGPDRLFRTTVLEVNNLLAADWMTSRRRPELGDAPLDGGPLPPAQMFRFISRNEDGPSALTVDEVSIWPNKRRPEDRETTNGALPAVYADGQLVPLNPLPDDTVVNHVLPHRLSAHCAYQACDEDEIDPMDPDRPVFFQRAVPCNTRFYCNLLNFQGLSVAHLLGESQVFLPERDNSDVAWITTDPTMPMKLSNAGSKKRVGPSGVRFAWDAIKVKPKNHKPVDGIIKSGGLDIVDVDMLCVEVTLDGLKELEVGHTVNLKKNSVAPSKMPFLKGGFNVGVVGSYQVWLVRFPETFTLDALYSKIRDNDFPVRAHGEHSWTIGPRLGKLATGPEMPSNLGNAQIPVQNLAGALKELGVLTVCMVMYGQKWPLTQYNTTLATLANFHEGVPDVSSDPAINLPHRLPCFIDVSIQIPCEDVALFRVTSCEPGYKATTYPVSGANGARVQLNPATYEREVHATFGTISVERTGDGDSLKQPLAGDVVSVVTRVKLYGNHAHFIKKHLGVAGTSRKPKYRTFAEHFQKLMKFGDVYGTAMHESGNGIRLEQTLKVKSLRMLPLDSLWDLCSRLGLKLEMRHLISKEELFSWAQYLPQELRRQGLLLAPPNQRSEDAKPTLWNAVARFQIQGAFGFNPGHGTSLKQLHHSESTVTGTALGFKGYKQLLNVVGSPVTAWWVENNRLRPVLVTRPPPADVASRGWMDFVENLAVVSATGPSAGCFALLRSGQFSPRANSQEELFMTLYHYLIRGPGARRADTTPACQDPNGCGISCWRNFFLSSADVNSNSAGSSYQPGGNDALIDYIANVSIRPHSMNTSGSRQYKHAISALKTDSGRSSGGQLAADVDLCVLLLRGIKFLREKSARRSGPACNDWKLCNMRCWRQKLVSVDKIQCYLENAVIYDDESQEMTLAFIFSELCKRDDYTILLQHAEAHNTRVGFVATATQSPDAPVSCDSPNKVNYNKNFALLICPRYKPPSSAAGSGNLGQGGRTDQQTAKQSKKKRRPTMPTQQGQAKLNHRAADTAQRERAATAGRQKAAEKATLRLSSHGGDLSADRARPQQHRSMPGGAPLPTDRRPSTAWRATPARASVRSVCRSQRVDFSKIIVLHSLRFLLYLVCWRRNPKPPQRWKNPDPALLLHYHSSADFGEDGSKQRAPCCGCGRERAAVYPCSLSPSFSVDGIAHELSRYWFCKPALSIDVPWISRPTSVSCSTSNDRGHTKCKWTASRRSFNKAFSCSKQRRSSTGAQLRGPPSVFSRLSRKLNCNAQYCLFKYDTILITSFLIPSGVPQTALRAH